MIGKTILHYKILEKIGEGGMGVVYKAEDTKLKRDVAIKFLPNYISSNEEERKRFEIEAQAAAALNHPNISTIFAIEESDGQMFIVMEYIDGIELKEKIKSGPIPNREAIKIASQIAEGLEAAHNKGIVHRDIKSSNIMITKDGKVKVMDFGLAKIGRGAQVTKIGSTVGTAAYMSPEQAKGEELDYRTDVWSFGVVFYEMLTGELPFKGDYEQALMFSILNEQPKTIQILASDISSVIIHILDRTLEKDVTLRYQSISEVLIELRRLQLSGSRVSSISRTSNAEINIPVSAEPKRNKKIVLWSVLAFVIVAAAATLFFFNPFASHEVLGPMKVVPLSALPGVEMQPAISPDGKEVAFAWNGGKGDNFNIYVQIIGTYEPQKLTNDSAYNINPVWMPDGRSIMFIRWKRSSVTSETGNEKYILIPARGGTEKELFTRADTYLAIGVYDYDITKSGKEAVSWIYDKSFKIVRRALVFNSIVDTITSPPENYLGDIGVCISPDDSKLAFLRCKVDFNIVELQVMAYPHGTPKKITNLKNYGGFSWIPEGEEMIVAEDGKLLRVSMDDGTKQTLPVTAGMYASQPNVSLVGNLMAFTRRTIRYPDLFRLNIGNSKKKDLQTEKIISSSMIEKNGKISPDGKRVVFISNRTGNNQIWVSDINGANSIPIAPVSETNETHPSWSPDGLFLVYEDAVAGIDIISSSGGSPVKILKINNYLPRFSADGKSIYFCSNNRRADNQIWKVSKDGSNAVQITKNGGEAAYESQDGKWLYYSRYWTNGKEGLFKLPVGGGEEQVVINKPVYRDSWVLRGNGIYYLNPTVGKLELLLYDFGKGKTTKIADFNKNTTSGYFDVSPKEDWILYSQSEETESDIMLVQNFR